MTGETAAKIIEGYDELECGYCYDGSYCDCFEEVIKMAADALRRKPCEDAISRAEVHDLLATWLSDKLDDDTREVLEVIDGKVEDMPPVTPIPCEDAISREDALMALTGEWTEPTDELIHRFIRRIKNLPSVTPMQRTGHWIEDDCGD